MLRRVSLLLLFTVTMLTGLIPGRALAKAPVLKGNMIVASRAVPGTTGYCYCDRRWYTVGLRPGNAVLSVELHSYTQDFSPNYGLRAVLLGQANNTVAYRQLACFKAQRHCNKTAHLRYRVVHPGVFYVLVYGLGGEGISYTLQVQGRIYALHCRASCR